MPKRVDPQERRELIAAALLRVVTRDGLGAVSLRHVATEAGVTSGMVQHYFPSKDSMLEFAMGTAGARYEQRITQRIAALGDSPDPAALLTALLGGLLPADPAELDDARVALTFQNYAAGHPPAADRLAADNAALRDHLGALILAATAAVGGSAVDVSRAHDLATGLLGAAEGLAIHVLCAGLPVPRARQALELLIRSALER